MMKTPGEEGKEDTAVLNDGDHDLRHVESHTVGTTMEAPADVFNSEQGDVDFRGVSWPAAAILIAKFQIGLGTLNIPHTFHVLGFVPGILCFLIIAAVSTVAGLFAQGYCPKREYEDGSTSLAKRTGKCLPRVS